MGQKMGQKDKTKNGPHVGAKWAVLFFVPKILGRQNVGMSHKINRFCCPKNSGPKNGPENGPSYFSENWPDEFGQKGLKPARADRTGGRTGRDGTDGRTGGRGGADGRTDRKG